MRKEIVATLARVQQSVEEDEQANHNMREISADRIMALFRQSVPEGVDLQAKYEQSRYEPMGFTLDEIDDTRLRYMVNFAFDDGRNSYRHDIIRGLQKEYEV